ncbi:MAG: TolC family protein [Acidobacteriota bacterium]|nr:TolC family protein [Acidobacteriota bacterium]
MNYQVILLSALLSLLGSTRVLGEELDLGSAMARAREQAREVTAARARAEAGDRRASQAKAYRLPSVSLQEIWIRTDSPADAFGLLLNQERFSLSEFAAGDPNDPVTTENATTRLALSLPVYTGGELSGRIRQARLAAEATHDTAAWIEEGAALSAGEAYIRLAQIREQVALLEHSLATVHAHVQLARAYVDQGMLVRSELLRAEVELSRLEDLSSQARGQAKVAEANLSFRLGADFSTAWQLEPLSDPVPLNGELAEWFDDADSRLDLSAAQRMLAAGELEVKVKKSGLLPKIGLVARRDWNDDELFGSNGDSTSIMAVANIDLFSGGRHRAAAAAARSEADAARSDIEQFRAGIRLAIKDAFEKASSSRERHLTALAAQESAREVERITRERFKKGIVKTIDLLDATTQRREAEMRELMARAEAHLASLALAVEAGRRPESVLPPTTTTTTTTNTRTE